MHGWTVTLEPRCSAQAALGQASAVVVAVPEGVLVEQVLGHAVLRGPHLPQVGNMVTQLLDGFHLLIQVVSLNEVTQLKGRQKKFKFRSNTDYPAKAVAEIPPLLSRFRRLYRK